MIEILRIVIILRKTHLLFNMCPLFNLIFYNNNSMRFNFFLYFTFMKRILKLTQKETKYRKI